MMRFMQPLIQHLTMQPSMDPIDEEIRKHDEQRELEDVVQPKGGFGGVVVEFGISADFSQEERGGEDGHYGEGAEGLQDFEADLMAEVAWVGEGEGGVEDEEVGGCGEEEVDYGAEEPVFEESDNGLIGWDWMGWLFGGRYGVTSGNESEGRTHHVIRYRLIPCRHTLSLGNWLI